MPGRWKDEEEWDGGCVSKCEAVGDELVWKGQMWRGCPAMPHDLDFNLAAMKSFENLSKWLGLS